MAVRAVVEDLIRNLTSDNSEERTAGLLNANFVFEQESCYGGYEWLMAHPEKLKEFRGDYAQTRPGQIREQFQTYVDDGLLGAEYLALRLSQDEEDELIHLLVRLLQSEDEFAGSAASILRMSGRLDTLPELVALIYRSATMDMSAAGQAAMATGCILESLSKELDAPPLTAGQEQDIK